MTSIKKNIEKGIEYFIDGLKNEVAGTKETGKIIAKYIKTRKITPEEEEALRIQFIDYLKIVGIIVPAAVLPGGTVIMSLMVKLAEKNGIELMPTSFNENKNNNEKRNDKKNTGKSKQPRRPTESNK